MTQYYTESWPVILQAVATSMQAGDPSMLAAIDGRESAIDVKANGPATLREEPTAFFFVIFGLVYEALATSSADSSLTTSARHSTVITALQALKCLVRPEYAGKVFLEPTTFDEFIGLCYRIAMTEAAAIQIHLVEMIVSLASSQHKISDAGGNIE